MSDVEEITEEGPEPIPRIFINYVDTFSAGAIAKIIRWDPKFLFREKIQKFFLVNRALEPHEWS